LKGEREMKWTKRKRKKGIRRKRERVRFGGKISLRRERLKTNFGDARNCPHDLLNTHLVLKIMVCLAMG
jgi:hypothetical protein